MAYARFAQVLSRFFQLTGSTGPVEDRVSPTAQLLSEALHPELGWYRQERPAAAALTQIAVAAQFSSVGILNRTGSGAIAVVDGVLIPGKAGQQDLRVGFGAAGSQSATTTAAILRDSRYGLQRGTIVGVTRANAAQLVSFGTTHTLSIFAGDPPVYLEGPWVLGPGAILYVENVAVNQLVEANFLWRERPVEEGELQNAIVFP